MVTFRLTLDCERTAFANLAIFSTLFQNLNDDPFHKHDKRLFCQITNQLIACKNVCGRKYVASEQARLLGTRQASTRAPQGQRVMLGRQLVGSMIRPNAAHTVLLLRYFGGKQKSATLRILRKVLPPQLPLKLAAFQDETNLEYKAGMI